MNNYIPIIAKGFARKISTDEILYLEQVQRKMTAVTLNGTYMWYERMENIEKQLDERFYHPMKKLVVNLEYIKSAENQCITFQNGVEIQMGRDSYIRTKQRFAAYLRKLI